MTTPTPGFHSGLRQPPSNASVPGGKTVQPHCVRAEFRTPAVAALYGARAEAGFPLRALEDVRRVLPGARPKAFFMEVLSNNTGAS